jgi:hypothetical protein
VVEVRFTKSARKHRIGRAHALAAMTNAGPPQVVDREGDYDERLVYIGPDDRGVELEIVALALGDLLLVIHVMPTDYRRTR